VLAVFLIKAFGPSGDSWASLIPLRGIQSPPEIYDTLSFWGKFWDNVHHMIAPVLCQTIQSFAGLTMLTKNSVLEQFHQLYAVAARARGLSKRKVLFKHVLRNSLIPLVTGFPARFVMMFFAGSVLIEKIFSLDGIGLLSYTALVERD
jgi:microcin C transport system permease protein